MTTMSSIQEAHERIKPFIHRTPLLTCSSLDQMSGIGNTQRTLYLKCENFNKVGAFKIRGATNAVLCHLNRCGGPDALTGGICTHSSGNHAQAMALAGKMFNIPAHIVMPNNAPSVKLNAVRDTYNAKVYLCEPTQQAREAMCEKVVNETNAYFIHPYDNADVIAGQGTVFLEMIEQLRKKEGNPDAYFDAILCPIGGGGLMSGVSIAARAILGDKVKIFGVEPEDANDAQRSLLSGVLTENLCTPQTICDGLKTNLKERTWNIIQKNVNQIFTVTDEEVVRAMKLVFERMKIVIEPSSAAVIAVSLFNQEFLNMGFKKVGLIISGGNCDLDNLPWNK
jgi:threonine dehydratase